jgi:hypothetical protein
MREKVHVNLRTVLGRIFNSAARSGLRCQPVNLAVHPGGSNCCTSATATRRGAAAAQNSDCSLLMALTTWIKVANSFFMSVSASCPVRNRQWVQLYRWKRGMS